MRSVLTDVAMIGPFHSRSAGIAKPAVLPHPVGPMTARLTRGSAAMRCRPLYPSVSRPGWVARTVNGRRSAVSPRNRRATRSPTPNRAARGSVPTTSG